METLAIVLALLCVAIGAVNANKAIIDERVTWMAILTFWGALAIGIYVAVT